MRLGWIAATAAAALYAAVGVAWPVDARTPAAVAGPPVTAQAAPMPVLTPSAEAAGTATAPPAAETAPAAGTASAAPPQPAQFAPPDDPRLAQVFAVLDAHCAQCHQTGKLTTPAPAGALANILDLRHIGREPHLVRRGEPDASLLYQVLLDRHRPLDLGPDAKWPGADDIARVRTWIGELGPAPAGPCEGSPPVTEDDIATSINQATLAAGEAASREMRFISLSHLANACATAVELDAYRQAVSKILNSLSWGAQPIAPTTIDAAKSILAFKLSDIGWVDEHWAALSRAEPKAIATDLTGKITSPGANPRPIRGDWLAFAAVRPPFYGELLGLPPTLDEAARLLGINRRGDLADGRGMRAGLRSSAVSRGPRIIERHAADTRRFWLAYDFSDGSGEHDIFERPLGGVRGGPDKAQFRADGQRLIFSLPNGFLGFALFEPDGHRIDQLPQRLELEPARAPAPTIGAQSCLSCHTAGLKPFTDVMRGHVLSDKFTGTREVKDQALALYDTQSDWARVLDEDSYRFRRALIQAGIDPDMSVHGVEPVAALAHRYTRNVDFATAAAEAGFSPAVLNAKLDGLVIPDRSLVHRLRQGLLSRADANRLLAALDGTPVAAPEPPLPPGAAAPALSLAIWTDRTAYKPGDLMTVYAQPSTPCYLTLISVNGTGKATVLFPSEFDPDNLVRPDAAFALPGEKAHYQFRLRDPGTETIIGRCQTVAKLPAGVEPDYERQRFTVLGSYENFLRTSYGLDSDAARQRTAAARAAKPAPAAVAANGKTEATARAAVSVTIK